MTTHVLHELFYLSYTENGTRYTKRAIYDSETHCINIMCFAIGPRGGYTALPASFTAAELAAINDRVHAYEADTSGVFAAEKAAEKPL